jgi:hypothetical protein
MKIAFLTSVPLNNGFSGYIRRCTALNDFLLSLGHDVDVICLKDIKSKGMRKLTKWFDYFSMPYHALTHAIDFDFDSYDLIYINHIWFLYSIPEKYLGRVLVDIHADAKTTFNFYSSTYPVLSALFDFESRKVSKFERKFLSRVKSIICCNYDEYLRYSSFGFALYVANGFDKFHYGPTAPNVPVNFTLGFLAGSSYRNVDAANRFLDICRDGGFRGHIGGMVCKKLRKRRGFGSVMILGALEEGDLGEFYRNISICFLPFNGGGGSKLKVLEAWSYGVMVFGYDDCFDGLSNFGDISPFIIPRGSEVEFICNIEKQLPFYREVFLQFSFRLKGYDWNTVFCDSGFARLFDS